MAKGKKYRNSARRFDPDQLHTVEEAVDLAKSLASATFDESVDMVVRLGIDPRKADQALRGTVALPSGTGRDVRVAVFAEGEAAQAAHDQPVPLELERAVQAKAVAAVAVYVDEAKLRIVVAQRRLLRGLCEGEAVRQHEAGYQ